MLSLCPAEYMATGIYSRNALVSKALHVASSGEPEIEDTNTVRTDMEHARTSLTHIRRPSTEDSSAEATYAPYVREVIITVRI